jgi:hypothetical protein
VFVIQQRRVGNQARRRRQKKKKSHCTSSTAWGPSMGPSMIAAMMCGLLGSFGQAGWLALTLADLLRDVCRGRGQTRCRSRWTGSRWRRPSWSSG